MVVYGCRFVFLPVVVAGVILGTANCVSDPTNCTPKQKTNFYWFTYHCICTLRLSLITVIQRLSRLVREVLICDCKPHSAMKCLAIILRLNSNKYHSRGSVAKNPTYTCSYRQDITYDTRPTRTISNRRSDQPALCLIHRQLLHPHFCLRFHYLFLHAAPFPHLPPQQRCQSLQ